ncbi:MAG: PQQ-binding-like beta-propeller repeat protein [Candidatus Thermoplasmatota archaeon]
MFKFLIERKMEKIVLELAKDSAKAINELSELHEKGVDISKVIPKILEEMERKDVFEFLKKVAKSKPSILNQHIQLLLKDLEKNRKKKLELISIIGIDAIKKMKMETIFESIELCPEIARKMFGADGEKYIYAIKEANRILRGSKIWNIEGKELDEMYDKAKQYFCASDFDNFLLEIENMKRALRKKAHVYSSWKYEFEDGIKCISCSLSKIFVLAGSKVYTFDRNCKLISSFAFHRKISALLAMLSGDKVFLGCEDGCVCLVDKDGKVIWEYMTGGYILGIDFVCGNKPGILVSSKDNNIYKLSFSGKLIWKRWVEVPVLKLSASKYGDYIICGIKDHNIYCYDERLLLRWRYMGGIWNDVGISKDDESVCGVSQGGEVCILSKLGHVTWKKKFLKPLLKLLLPQKWLGVIIANESSAWYIDKKSEIKWQYEFKKPIEALASHPFFCWSLFSTGKELEMLENRSGLRYISAFLPFSKDVQEAMNAYDKNEYEDGYKYMESALEKFIEEKKEKAKDELFSISNYIKKANEIGIDVKNIEEIFEIASEEFDFGDYLSAEELASQGCDAFLAITKTRDEEQKIGAQKRIKLLIGLIEEANEMGAETEDMEAELENAMNALSSEKYGSCLSILDKIEKDCKIRKTALPSTIHRYYADACKLLEGTIDQEADGKIKKYLSAAILYYEKTNNLRKLGECYEKLAYLEEKQGRIPTSKTLYQKAVNTYFQLGEYENVLTILMDKMKKLGVVEVKTEWSIDDVFLIYWDGRLITHNTRRLKPDVDHAILGGMLITIQNFVQDGFKEEGEVLNEIKYGRTRIILEKGKYVYLAVVVTGTPPLEIKDTMIKIIKKVEEKFENVLSKWDGEYSKLWGVKKIVDELIQ